MKERMRLIAGTGLFVSLLVMVLFLGVFCGDNGTKPPPSDDLTDFSYRDLNPRSTSFEEYLSPGGLNDGKSLILFCGELECSVCLRQFYGLQEALKTINGKTESITGWMINYAIDAGVDTFALHLREIDLPVLQDTMILNQGTNTPAITVSNDIYSRDLVLVRPDLTIYKRSSCGNESEQIYDLDLTTQGGIDTLLSWINAMISED